MEKFIYLFRVADDATATEEQRRSRMPEWNQWMEQLAHSGNLIGAERLHNTGVQVTGLDKVVTDGPFIEAKEMVGGYLLINAKDISHAVELSKGCPIFAINGKVEVRPIQTMDM